MNVTLTNSTNVWSGDFTPLVTNAVGQANITILQMDGNTINNAGTLTLDATFDIKNNFPDIGVKLNATELYSDEVLNMVLNFT